MNQGDRNYFENREKNGFSHLNTYRPDIIIPRIKDIMRETKIRSGSFVLDFGCAKGFYIKGFKQEGILAVGYDISKHAVFMANKFLNKKLAFTNFKKIEDIALEKKFDLVLIKDTAEHIKESELNKALERIKKIAVKILVVVPVTKKGRKKCLDLYKDPTHINMHSDSYWKKYLGKYGSVKNMPVLIKKLKKEYSTICCAFLVNFK